MFLITILGLLGLMSLARVGEGEPEGMDALPAVPIPGPGDETAVVGDPEDLPATADPTEIPIKGFDDDEEELEEEEEETEETDEAAETETPAPPAPPKPQGEGVPVRDPESEAQFWFDQHSRQAAQVRQLEAELARLSGQGPAPTAPAGPTGANAPAAPGPAALPPLPTADQLAARFGTSEDDPLIAYALAQEQQQRLLLSELQKVQQQLAPVQQTYAQQQQEQRIEADFVAWLNDPTQVAPEARAEVAALWPHLRPMIGKRVANWTDGVHLLRSAEAVRAAPAVAYEEGRRQGNTDQAQRLSRGALAAAAAGPISPRKMGTPMVASVDEAFRMASAKRRRG